MIDRSLRTVLSFTFLYGVFACLALGAHHLAVPSVSAGTIQSTSADQQGSGKTMFAAAYDLASSE
jgi:hypothetical protein